MICVPDQQPHRECPSPRHRSTDRDRRRGPHLRSAAQKIGTASGLRRNRRRAHSRSIGIRRNVSQPLPPGLRSLGGADLRGDEPDWSHPLDVPDWPGVRLRAAEWESANRDFGLARRHPVALRPRRGARAVDARCPGSGRKLDQPGPVHGNGDVDHRHSHPRPDHGGAEHQPDPAGIDHDFRRGRG